MSLKSTWNHDDTSNRIITEPLSVRYTTDEVYYDIAPKGTGEKPSYVTEAEEAIEEINDEAADVYERRETVAGQLATAKTAMDTAYSTWYASQTLGNYQSYMSAANTYYTVRNQARSIDAEATALAVSLKAATQDLNDANEQWAEEQSSVEYKGGRFLGYEHHRLATMRMKYVGFSLSAANSCKAYFDSLYTRSICKSASFNDGVIEILHQTANPSSVRISYAGGDNYSVEMDVTEDDVKLSTTAVESSTLFTTENTRVYL